MGETRMGHPLRRLGPAACGVALALVVACTTTAPSPSPTRPPTAAPSPSPSATPEPTPEATAQPVPMVPVVGFWSTTTGISTAELKAALAGTSSVYDQVLVAGSWPGATPATVDDLVARVNDEPRAIGLLPASEMRPDVRALAVDGVELFGNDRLRTLSGWPLLAAVSSAGNHAAFDPAATWTLVAGGDVMLDRMPYVRMVVDGKGADYAWDGGYVEITGTRCCSVVGYDLPISRRIGGAGALRALFREADLAVVNLEGPAPDDFTYHPATGFVFTMDPALLEGLANAGIDAVTLANNHIGNAGPSGIIQTIGHLDEFGIAHTGAGANFAAAHQPAWFEIAGRRVAIFGYDAIRAAYHATGSRAGSAGLVPSAYEADIAAARAAGADVVVALPHWGIEYTAATTAAQRGDARGLIAAGADLVLGSHSHWPGALQWISGQPVLYSMGDLVFDLLRSTETLEGLVVEATFAGDRLVQVRLHPTLILGRVQPNLLTPEGGGAAVIDRVRRASVFPTGR